LQLDAQHRVPPYYLCRERGDRRDQLRLELLRAVLSAPPADAASRAQQIVCGKPALAVSRALDNNTLLMAAVKNVNGDYVRVLLQAARAVSQDATRRLLLAARPSGKQTALHEQSLTVDACTAVLDAATTTSALIVELLGAQNEQGRTPLHNAALKQDAALLAVMLKHLIQCTTLDGAAVLLRTTTRADTRPNERFDETVLHTCAALGGRAAHVAALLECASSCGVKQRLLDCRNSDNRRAFEIAIAKNDVTVLAAFGVVESSE
jgi:hypothetical protein